MEFRGASMASVASDRTLVSLRDACPSFRSPSTGMNHRASRSGVVIAGARQPFMELRGVGKSEDIDRLAFWRHSRKWSWFQLLLVDPERRWKLSPFAQRRIDNRPQVGVERGERTSLAPPVTVVVYAYDEHVADLHW